jgi:ribA/ribD-fused uncharacterized protein
MTIAFTKVRLPYGWMGNMAPYPITHGGLLWRTSEALFQALRLPEGHEVRELIRTQKSPMAAKMTAKRYASERTVVPMSEIDVDLMRTVLRLKVSQHPDLTGFLVRTGSERLIEDCSNRPNESGLFWGAALRGDQWVGKNTLGRLWEELRTDLSPGAIK